MYPASVGDLERGFARIRCDNCNHECLLDYMRTTLALPDGLPGIVMAIHTFGEYLDFHPHLHALVADGLFVREGMFHVLPEVSLKPLEELFRARIITFLTEKGLLPPDCAQMLRGWVHSGFSAHRSRQVMPNERADLERLAQYIIRNPFSVENKMRGQRDKRTAEAVQASAGNAVEVIDVSEHNPRRIPSAKWRELIKKVWEADPLLCPNCQSEMRIVALIDDRKVIERILRHLGLWAQGVRVIPSTGPPPHPPR